MGGATNTPKVPPRGIDFFGHRRDIVGASLQSLAGTLDNVMPSGATGSVGQRLKIEGWIIQLRIGIGMESEVRGKPEAHRGGGGNLVSRATVPAQRRRLCAKGPGVVLPG